MTNRSRSPDLRLAVALLLFCAACASAREVSIRIIHTTDLHGHLLPVRDYDGREGVGGLLRAASAIRELSAGQSNRLLLDAGDLFQGGAESFLNQGRVMTRALDVLGYDAWVIGNHEFDWGLDVLVARHAEPKAVVLGANLSSRPDRRSPLDRVQPFFIREFEGVRVAVIGVTTPGIPTWSLPDQLGDVQVDDPVESLRAVLPRVRDAKADVILLVAHQGWRPGGDDHANRIQSIADAFPDVHAIIGAHTHVVVPSRMLGPVLYTQAGYHGIAVGCIDLAFDTVAHSVTKREARVVDVGDRYPLDPELSRIFEKELATARSYLSEPVGFLEHSISPTPDANGLSPVQAIIARSIADVARADVVFHGTFSDDPVPAGTVTMERVMEIIPYENRIGVALLTASEIREIAEEQDRWLGKSSHLALWGMDRVPGGDAGTVMRMPDGSAPHPRRRYRVAFNSYALASGGLRYPVLRAICQRPESRLELLPGDTRTALRNALRAHHPLQAGARP